MGISALKFQLTGLRETAVTISFTALIVLVTPLLPVTSTPQDCPCNSTLLYPSRLLLDQRDSLRSRCCSNNHGHAGQITLFPHPPGREASHWHVDLGPHVSGWYYFSGRCRSPLPASSGTRGLSRIRRRIRNLPSISPPFFHSITREQEESQVREGVSVHLIFLVSVRVLFLRVCVLSRSGCVSKARSVCVWNLLRPDRGSLFKQFWVPIPDLSWLCPSIDSFFSFLCSFRV